MTKLIRNAMVATVLGAVSMALAGCPSGPTQIPGTGLPGTTAGGGTVTNPATGATCRTPAGNPQNGTSKHGQYNGQLLPSGWSNDLDSEAAVTTAIRGIESKVTDWEAWKCLYPGAYTVYLGKR